MEPLDVLGVDGEAEGTDEPQTAATSAPQRHPPRPSLPPMAKSKRQFHYQVRRLSVALH